MDKVVGEVDRWFYEGSDLADAVNEFASSHKNDFEKDPLGKDTNSEGIRGWQLFKKRDDSVHGSVSFQNSMGESMHVVRDLHLQFCSIFEDALTQFTSAAGITDDQFKQVFMISQQEERESGKHFYRWLDATDFTTFLTVMQLCNSDPEIRPVTVLRKYISDLSSEARENYRRRRMVLPLLDMWETCTFQDIISLVNDLPLPTPPPLATRKELARWRNRLNIPKLASTAPEEDKREEWGKYCVMSMKHLTDDELQDAILFMKKVITSIELTEDQQQDRTSWEAFHSMDVNFNRKIDFVTLRSVFAHIPPLHTKSSQKTIIKHETILRKVNEAHPSLNLSEFRALLKELNDASSNDSFLQLCRDITTQASNMFSQDE
eukprot:TRINITY_DN10222_c0_g1_i2.p1 TRINITY_DN10222_c0_g1~~TRINITY_DN10222_c0_g1_i2.p1  ORF type:complete len:376 (+),score=61.52 TRINITY_DN10222_c0_g1_i2:189-1316(+)